MKHKVYVGLSVIILVFLYFLCRGPSVVIAQQVGEQNVSRVATITVVDINGTAQILSKEEVERQKDRVRVLTELWKPALPRTMLTSGDQLQTGKNSSMKLQLNDGTTVMLSSDTLLVVEELRSARGQMPQTTQLRLEKGKIATQQTVTILGQTNQIIRTGNGSVNTRLGEVEVWKPEQESKKYALLAALSPQLPQIAQESTRNDNTYVTLSRGTAVIESSGQGRMITDSFLLPETCVGQDGIKFTLDKPKSQVTVAKLEDENGFRLTSNEVFQLLAGTEGMVNKIIVATQNSEAAVDIEGVNVAEQAPNSRSIIHLHPLLTVGVKSSDVIVNLNCDETESRGLDKFDIQGVAGNVDISRTDFGGRGTDRPNPSRGQISMATPTPIRTPTPTPIPTEVTPTPTATPGITLTPPPPIPLTYVFSPVPVVYNLGTPTVGALGTGGCAGGQYPVTIDFWYNDQSMNVYDKGGVIVYRWNVLAAAIPGPWGPPTGGADESIPSSRITILNPPITYTFPAGETGHLQFNNFCVDFLGQPFLGITVQVRNSGGYTSTPRYFDPVAHP